MGGPHRVQQPFDELQTLIQQLGIYDVPATFFLSDVVAPVSIVNSQVTLTAEASPIIPDLRSSAGELVNPAANTRLADTGALAAGTYYIQLMLSGANTAGLFWRLRIRNAADAADVRAWLIRTNTNLMYETVIVETLQLNERLVLENNIAPGAGLEVQAVIFTKLLI